MSNQKIVVEMIEQITAVIAKLDGVHPVIVEACPFARRNMQSASAYLRAAVTELNDVLCMPIEPLIEHSGQARRLENT